MDLSSSLGEMSLGDAQLGNAGEPLAPPPVDPTLSGAPGGFYWWVHLPQFMAALATMDE